jgi:hypothetical protein
MTPDEDTITEQPSPRVGRRRSRGRALALVVALAAACSSGDEVPAVHDAAATGDSAAASDAGPVDQALASEEPDGAGPAVDGAASRGDGAAPDAFHSAEGQYCSSTPDEDPFYACLAGPALACVTTYGTPVLAGDNATIVTRPIYLCRATCDDAHPCALADDVCCHGTAGGGGAVRACAPSRYCDHP